MSHCVIGVHPGQGQLQGSVGTAVPSPPFLTRTLPLPGRAGPQPHPPPSGAQSRASRAGPPKPGEGGASFPLHLMGMRPDSRAVRLAIFRVRLCNFVEGMTK